MRTTVTAFILATATASLSAVIPAGAAHAAEPSSAYVPPSTFNVAQATGPSSAYVAPSTLPASTPSSAPASSVGAPSGYAPASTATASTTPARGSGLEAPSLRGPSLWGIVPWGGIGVGGRFMIPLSISPLLGRTSIRDSFALEVGADFLHYSDSVGAGVFSYSWSWNEILPVVGMMWNLWLNDKFAVYPKAEAGYAFAWVSGSSGTYGTGYGGIFASGAGGAIYKLDNGLTLRGEIGISGAKLGVGWLF